MFKINLKYFLIIHICLILDMDKIIRLIPNLINKQKRLSTIFRLEAFNYSSSTFNQSQYKIIKHGNEDTKNFRIYFESNNQIISPFHDIPLFSDKEKNILNMIVEIPRFTHAKMEINKKEYLNPISQDSKKDKLRYINNIFPYYGYIWNYGAFPQTYDDPNHIDETTGCIGDNDPIDVCEIGSLRVERGSIIQVKVLGALGLIDEGEADWKILTINVNDPMANELNDISDVEAKLSGLLNATRDWFKIYKIPTGKPANKFALDGKFFDKAFSLKVIEKSNRAWSHLVEQTENNKNISVINTTLNNKSTVSSEISLPILKKRFDELSKQNARIEKDFNELERVYYVDRAKL